MGFYPVAVVYNKTQQITHITQNNTTTKRNTAHKTTHTIKDKLHRLDSYVNTKVSEEPDAAIFSVEEFHDSENGGSTYIRSHFNGTMF
jgi:hypothetical protein